jgi:dihydroorotase
LSFNGPEFYQFPASPKSFIMEKAPSQTSILETPTGAVTPLPTGMGIELTWRITQ